MYINLNGEILAADNTGVPYDNGTFRYGHGLFETMLVMNGAIQLYECHADRLFHGLKVLMLDIGEHISRSWLQEQILATVRANDLKQLSKVRLQFFAGSGGFYSDTIKKAGFIIECSPVNKQEVTFNEKGQEVCIAQGIRKSADTIANLKSCNALIYVSAAQQAKAAGYDDALIVNGSGNIIESTIANIFWVKDKQVFTPPLTEGCVAGVMRRYIIEHCSEVIETQLTQEVLLAADEVFLTNAVKRIKWISSFAPAKYHCAITRELHHHLFYGTEKLF